MVCLVLSHFIKNLLFSIFDVKVKLKQATVNQKPLYNDGESLPDDERTTLRLSLASLFYTKQLNI